ncbi:hypothetical protein M422DRAFT_24785 [Sphaerobolus stellatus SS14]|nr:hypothetical protein M422DRAFT_24785 [Sphaerobolus stellatus SS14]
MERITQEGDADAAADNMGFDVFQEKDEDICYARKRAMSFSRPPLMDGNSGLGSLRSCLRVSWGLRRRICGRCCGETFI